VRFRFDWGIAGLRLNAAIIVGLLLVLLAMLFWDGVL